MSMTWSALASRGVFPAEAEARLRGRSVVLLCASEINAAAALLQLQGLVRRMVLYPPDLPVAYLPLVAAHAEAEVILCDGPLAFEPPPGVAILTLRGEQTSLPAAVPLLAEAAEGEYETEWVLLTSGTTGAPKLVVHTLGSLTAAIALDDPPAPHVEAGQAGPGQAAARQAAAGQAEARQAAAGQVTAGQVTEQPHARSASPTVWSTFYDIRRYGGLQIFLRAALSGCSLVLGAPAEPLSAFLLRASAAGLTHISGTPSHWRRALMHPEAAALRPTSIRLSGEIADTAILHQLRVQYPQARIVHAFASTEAGVVCEVIDGAMGIPAPVFASASRVQMRIEMDTLRVRSSGTASRYLGAGSPELRDSGGWVDTGDVLEERAGRFFFAGRRDGTINVGGQKVHPEEVEAVINLHPEVRMSLVSTRKNPIMGAVVTANVVLKQAPGNAQTAAESGAGSEIVKREIFTLCRAELARHKVPVAIQFVPALPVTPGGKLVRRLA